MAMSLCVFQILRQGYSIVFSCDDRNPSSSEIVGRTEGYNHPNYRSIAGGLAVADLHFWVHLLRTTTFVCDIAASKVEVSQNSKY